MVKHDLSYKLYSRQYQEEWLIQSKIRQTEYLLKKVKGILNEKKGKLLDVGCGVGTWASIVSDKFGFEATGIDINTEAIRKSKEQKIKALRADIESRWPLPDNSFSVVTMIQVIEHVVNPDHLLEEARRVLAPGGILLITTPNLAAWFNRLILLAGFQPFFLEVSVKDKTAGLSFTRKFTKEREPVGHIHVFTVPALKDLLKINGFQTRKVIGGEIEYLPKFMKPFDWLFSKFTGLASDIIIIAKKKK